MVNKLTPQQWKTIKEKIQVYNIPITTLTKEYNLSRVAIHLYFKRHGWSKKPVKLTFKQKIKKIWNITNN